MCIYVYLHGFMKTLLVTSACGSAHCRRSRLANKNALFFSLSLLFPLLSLLLVSFRPVGPVQQVSS